MRSCDEHWADAAADYSTVLCLQYSHTLRPPYTSAFSPHEQEESCDSGQNTGEHDRTEHLHLNKQHKPNQAAAKDRLRLRNILRNQTLHNTIYININISTAYDQNMTHTRGRAHTLQETTHITGDWINYC